MKKILLLGAGASKAYDASSVCLKIPISRDFLQTFTKIPEYNNPWVLKFGLMDYLKEQYLCDPLDILVRGVDIEDLHTEIEDLWRNALESGDRETFIKYTKPYTEILFIFAMVLNSIQNGPVSECHCRLAKVLQHGDGIITFNWDTLMDRALQVECGWSTDNGYGFVPCKIMRGSWVDACACSSMGPTLLKLHGSTNWITSHSMLGQNGLTLSQSSSPNTVYVYEYSNGPYDAWRGRYMDGYAPFSYGYYPPNIPNDPEISAEPGRVFVRTKISNPDMPEGSAGKSGLTSMPLIVPPVRHKEYGMFGDLFEDLWKRAEDMIASAEQIVIIGYSFPKTDLRTTALFLAAFQRRKDLPRITIIDPQPDNVAHLFQSSFGITDRELRVIKGFFSVDTVVEDLFNAN